MSSGLRIAVPPLLVLLGVCGGVVIGLLREATPFTALVLFSEPAPAVIGVCVVHLCFTAGRWPEGIAAAIGTASFLLLARGVPPIELSWGASGDVPAWIDDVTQCAADSDAPDSWILAQWTGADDAGTARTLTDMADVVVFFDAQLDLVSALEAAGGELLAVPGGTSVWARSGLALCGETDAWPVGDGAALVFAGPFSDLSVPLLVAKLPAFGDPLEHAVADLTAVTRALQPWGVVVAASASFPTSFRRTDVLFARSGAYAVPLPPNAPEAWGPVPLLTLRAVDRVWANDGWNARGEGWSSGTALRAPMLTRLDAHQTP